MVSCQRAMAAVAVSEAKLAAQPGHVQTSTGRRATQRSVQPRSANLVEAVQHMRLVRLWGLCQWLFEWRLGSETAEECSSQSLRHPANSGSDKNFEVCRSSQQRRTRRGNGAQQRM